MKFLSSIFLIAVTAVASASGENVTRCGAHAPDHDVLMNDHADIAAAQANVAATFRINTYVHLVETLAKQYRYSQSQVYDQMNVLNKAYAPLGISFNLIATTRTINSEWASSSPGSNAGFQMMSALRRGGYNVLNLYFLSDLGSAPGYEPLLGFCTFPVQSPTPQQITMDGCLNGGDTLPGGAQEHYDLGFTAVHEVGHWFYLLHVFHDRMCTEPGDFVNDTPIQSLATNGCPGYQDSCPYSPGADSIHNFMDYSYDRCLDQFTSGQGERARSAYEIFRANA